MMKNDTLYLILLLGALMVILAWLIMYNKINQIQDEDINEYITILKVC